jgi:hypothetical protein
LKLPVSRFHHLPRSYDHTQVACVRSPASPLSECCRLGSLAADTETDFEVQDASSKSTPVRGRRRSRIGQRKKSDSKFNKVLAYLTGSSGMKWPVKVDLYQAEMYRPLYPQLLQSQTQAATAGCDLG